MRVFGHGTFGGCWTSPASTTLLVTAHDDLRIVHDDASQRLFGFLRSGRYGGAMFGGFKHEWKDRVVIPANAWWFFWTDHGDLDAKSVCRFCNEFSSVLACHALGGMASSGLYQHGKVEFCVRNARPFASKPWVLMLPSDSVDKVSSSSFKVFVARWFCKSLTCQVLRNFQFYFQYWGNKGFEHFPGEFFISGCAVLTKITQWNWARLAASGVTSFLCQSRHSLCDLHFRTRFFCWCRSRLRRRNGHYRGDHGFLPAENSNTHRTGILLLFT